MDITPDSSLPASLPSRSGVAVPRYAVVGFWLHRLLMLLAGLFIFILALQLVKQGAREYGQQIIQWLQVSNPTSSLGFGWLLSYVFLSGSPVAAIAVALFAAGTISDVQTFTMITGSRLGASFVVLLVGFVYHLRGYRQESSISTGVMALLTTAAIYLPALVPGYWLLTSGALEFGQLQAAAPVDSWSDQIYTPMVQVLDAWLPGWALLIGGIVALLGGFSLIDRALPALTPDHAMPTRIERLMNYPITLFLLGAAITSFTLSVSVSLSLLIPLVARGIIRPRHSLPYIMGANITTFIDTLVAALLIGGPAAFTIVFVEMASVALLSGLVLIFCYRWFEQALVKLHDRIIQNNSLLVFFIGIMLIVPVLLLLQ